METEQIQITLPDCMGGLVCAANKYTRGQCPSSAGLTMVFAHCTNGHKEQWDVTIQKLFELAAGTAVIQEAWALDLQSHGASAVLNQEKLRSAQPISAQDYGDLLYHFSQSAHVAGRRLIGVGHSSSTTAWCLAWKRSSKPPVEAFIMIEPVMLPPPIAEDDPRIMAGPRNVRSVLTRLNEWDNMEALALWMKKRYPWKLWDKRILDIHIKHGFITVNIGSSSYVTSRVPRNHEAKLYEHHDHVAAGEVVHEICAQVPMHCIFGERPEMVSLKSRALLCDSSQGRKMASVTIVPKVGHLAVQEDPEAIAVAIYDVLKTTSNNNKARL